jgi:Concanavalin A-like lectin/glucanases superfamily
MFSSRKSSAPAAAGAADPQFNYVTALLHGDGTNGAQNNTFVDSSTNAFTITRNGTPTQGSFSPYGSLWSNYFNGSTDYLGLTANAAFSFGTGALTAECWFYVFSATSYESFIDFWPNSSGSYTVGQWQLGTDNAGHISFYLTTSSTSAGNLSVTSSSTYTVNAWNYAAVVRSGTTVTLYLNGTSVGTLSVGSNIIGASTLNGSIGRQTTGSAYFNGYISNARIVNGTAVYTANFTPPTAPLTAITNTSLLTCQSNRFIDNSTNNFTITPNGTPSVQRFNPFLPTSSQAYSTSVYGGSGYFNGSTDYFTFAPGSATVFGTGNFTVECWVYATLSPHTNGMFMVDGRNSSQTTGFDFYFGSGNGITWAGPSSSISNSTTYNANTWYHVAYVRNGTTGTIYVNGVSAASGTDNNNYTTSLTTAYIACRYSIANYVQGYMTDFRINNGTAVYTSAFTPPTAPLTAVTNTQLLLSYQNAGIYDNAMMNDGITLGSTQISTSVKKYGTGSISFNGSTDGLTFKSTPNLAMGSGNFTIEFWVYLNANQNNYTKYFCSGTSVNSLILDQQTSTNTITVNNNSSIFLTSGAISNTTWTHVAIVRSGATLTIYLNGTSSASTSNSTVFIASDTLSSLGCYPDGTKNLNGYIDDFRITKGYARYTTSFTPPTSAFPNYGS